MIVNNTSASLYDDFSFAKDNFTITNGNNTFIAIAHDSYGRYDTNAITVNLPATNVFAYDLNGNMLTNGSEVLIYNDENELMTNWVAGSWKSEFVYDGKLRRRIEREYGWNGSRWIQTNETRFIYDGNVIVQHRDANNIPALSLTRGRDLSGSFQGAGGIGGLLAMTESSTGENSYYQADGSGNVTCLVNSSQVIVAKAEYDPYGDFLSLSGSKSFANSYWFSSKPNHWPSGKYDFLYRWYVPQLQRWSNRDPLGEKGFEVMRQLGTNWSHFVKPSEILEGANLHVYVRNQPLSRRDVFGLGRVDTWPPNNTMEPFCWPGKNCKTYHYEQAGFTTVGECVNAYLSELTETDVYLGGFGGIGAILIGIVYEAGGIATGVTIPIGMMGQAGIFRLLCSGCVESEK